MNDEAKNAVPGSTDDASTGFVSALDAQPPFVLTLDIGSSSVRAALFDSLGREVAETESRRLRSFTTTPDGGAEMEAQQSIADVEYVIDTALARSAPFGPRIAAVAVACFWHSLVGVGRQGQAQTPVFGWADTRARSAVEELRQRFDEQATHARTGCCFHPSYWPAKLLWLRHRNPDLYGSVARWMSLSDLLALHIHGNFDEAATSVSMASGTGLLDQRRCVWDEELLAGLGLNCDQLPALAETGETYTIKETRALERWPQLGEIPWFYAVGDGAANNIGEGGVTPETMALMIGTSGALRVVAEGAPPRALPRALWCYRVDRRRVVVGGALSDGGGLRSWIAESFAFDADGEAIERALAAMEPDGHGLTILPFWLGERSTNWSATARGAILGLTVHTRPIEVLRAAMEAVAYRFALIADALERFAPRAEIRASGGALWASAVWAQILADVLNRPLHLSRVREATSRGACLLALEALGRIKKLNETPASPRTVCEPDGTRHERYRAALERQQNAYKILMRDKSSKGRNQDL